MPLSLLVEVQHGVWTWSFWWCLLYSWADVFLCSASIVHMSVISLDRYMGISKPLKARAQSRRVVAIKIAFVWLVTTVISSPLVVLALMDHFNLLGSNNVCAINNRYYMIYGSTLSFLIPLIIMSVTYFKTTKLLNQQASLLTQKAADGSHSGLRRTMMPHRKLGYARSTVSTTQQQQQQPSIVLPPIDGGGARPLPSNNNNNNGCVKGAQQQGRKGSSAMSSAQSSFTGSTTAVGGGGGGAGAAQQPSPPSVVVSTVVVDEMGGGSQCHHHQHLHKCSAFERRSLALKSQIVRLRSQTATALLSLAGRNGEPTSAELANEHKATRVLAVVFCCFFICWTPFFVSNFTLGFCGELCAVPDWANSIFLWLGYMSSTINPLIYTIFNRRFRQSFLRILRCQCIRTVHRHHSLRDWTHTHTYIANDSPSWSFLEKTAFIRDAVRSRTVGLTTTAHGTYTPPLRTNAKASYPTATAMNNNNNNTRTLSIPGHQSLRAAPPVTNIRKNSMNVKKRRTSCFAGSATFCNNNNNISECSSSIARHAPPSSMNRPTGGRLSLSVTQSLRPVQQQQREREWDMAAERISEVRELETSDVMIGSPEEQCSPPSSAGIDGLFHHHRHHHHHHNNRRPTGCLELLTAHSMAAGRKASAAYRSRKSSAHVPTALTKDSHHRHHLRRVSEMPMPGVRKMLEQTQITFSPLSRSVSAAILEVAERAVEHRSIEEQEMRAKTRARRLIQEDFAANFASFDDEDDEVDIHCGGRSGGGFFKRKSHLQVLVERRRALLGSVEVPLAIAQSWLALGISPKPAVAVEAAVVEPTTTVTHTFKIGDSDVLEANEITI